MVPHLTTSLTGPLNELERLVLDQAPGDRALVPHRSGWSTRRRSTRRWTCATAASSWRRSTPTSSRAASTTSIPTSCRCACTRRCRRCRSSARTRSGFLLVPENHTRNLIYLQNVAVLKQHPRGRGPARCASAASSRTSTEPTDGRDCRAARSCCWSRSSARATAWCSTASIPARSCSTTTFPRGIPAILRGLEQAVVPPLVRGLDHAAQVAPLPRLRPRGRGLRAS